MSGESPPKPWERAGAGGASVAVPGSMTSSAATPTTTTTSTAVPALPARSDALSTVANRTAANYSTISRPSPYGMGSSPYGMGGYGGMSSYSSPYSRFGGMGGMSSMYGGGMYGGMGGGMGGYGGYGGMNGGMYGQPGQIGPDGQPVSLTQAYSNSTQATFQMIESIVGAFGGFAQMLESTYMATHSSFFAMVSVAEQFGNLKQTLGSVLGIFTIMRWIRTAIAKLTGRPPPASSTELTSANFAQFTGQPGPDGQPGAVSKPSRKPFIFFVIAVFGLPWLMNKLIRALAASQEAQQQQMIPLDANGQPTQPLDPSKLDFCRVIYDYTPQTQPGQAFHEGIDLAVKKGDLVAVLSKTDPMGQPSEWWRCRARDGGVGYLPSPYLETIHRKPPRSSIMAHGSQSQSGSETNSRVNTMTSASVGSRADSLKITDREKAEILATSKEPPLVKGKPGDMGIESFQKGAFHT